MLKLKDIPGKERDVRRIHGETPDESLFGGAQQYFPGNPLEKTHGRPSR
jgi:hypothetical protein